MSDIKDNSFQLLTEEELGTSVHLYNKRIEYLIRLGEIKLSEIENEKHTTQNYSNIVELNTKENMFKESLYHKYGKGYIDIDKKVYVKQL